MFKHGFPAVTQRIALSGLLLVVVAGCPESSNLVQATGTLMVDGKPAEGASIIYFPEGKDFVNVAAGASDANGKYSLVSNTKPGIAPGKYKVTVTWPDPAKKPSNEDVAMGRAQDAPDLLKGRYAAKEKSTINVEVTPAMTELPAIELKTK